MKKRRISIRKRAILSLIFFLIFSQEALGEILKKDAVRAIIGEAGGQGRRGMLYIACALRNRGTLNGVYGFKAKHVDKEPEWVWELARAVWKQSEYEDISNGATHWENIKAYGVPYWVKSMNKVAEYKDHVFYKEK